MSATYNAPCTFQQIGRRTQIAALIDRSAPLEPVAALLDSSKSIQRVAGACRRSLCESARLSAKPITEVSYDPLTVREPQRPFPLTSR